MRRTVRISVCLAVLAVVCVLGCKMGGIDTIDAYKDAVEKIQPQIKAVDGMTSTAQRASDPAELGRGMGPLVGAVSKLRVAVGNVKVSGPALTAVHDQLVQTVDAYAGVIDSFGEKVTSTPLTESKLKLKAAVEAFQMGIATWRGAVATFQP